MRKRKKSKSPVAYIPPRIKSIWRTISDREGRTMVGSLEYYGNRILASLKAGAAGDEDADANGDT